MGEEPTGGELNPEELAYYRAVEDHFATLRETRFLFSPKDFGLLQGWWTEGVPLAAVLAGISEVMERRRARGGEVVSSLSYCRHAVVRHARRLAAGGRPDGATTGLDVAGLLGDLGTGLDRAAERWRQVEVVHREVERLARAVRSIPPDADPAAVDEALARLETGMVTELAEHLPEEQRVELDEAVRRSMAGVQLDEGVRERTEKAVRLRCLRELLGLPRLGLDAG